ncbi:MAG: histidinol-phosphatase HisJ family protein [Eubacteriales bacterium]
MQKSNFHTHTTYSDGHNTPEEMISAALDCGFSVLGFSDHSYARECEDYSMSIAGEKEYFREIHELSDRYAGRLRICCGLEQDGESSLPDNDYDYILSSVHELVRHGECYVMDASAELQRDAVRRGFGGSFVEMAKCYFERVTEHVIRQKTDIVGHFDLVTKFGLFPEDDPRYRDAALEAVREIVKHCSLFELNTGAIARGLRTVPYPAGFLLDEIRRLGGRVLITSDCHYRERLTVWFDEGERFLAAHGFIKDEHADLNDRVKDIEIWR